MWWGEETAEREGQVLLHYAKTALFIDVITGVPISWIVRRPSIPAPPPLTWWTRKEEEAEKRGGEA